MAAPPDLVAGSATGSIFDLGYRGYDGPRLGRRHAISTLFAHSLKWTFGIGRGGRAKIAPFALAGLTLLPAILAVGIRALAGAAAAERMSPITPQTYLTYVQTFIAFFVTAQAPELLGRDQRHHVLTLYFSRALERTDYALAKYGALVCALALVLLLPQVVLLLGIVFASLDLGAGVGEALPLILPIVLSTAVAAAFFSGVGLVIAAFTPRRAFAAGAIVAVFLVLSGVVSLLVAHGRLRDPFRYVALLDPYALLDGLASTLFGGVGRNVSVTRSGIDPGLFAAGACLVAVATLVVLVLRYRRIEA